MSFVVNLVNHFHHMSDFHLLKTVYSFQINGCRFWSEVEVLFGCAGHLHYLQIQGNVSRNIHSTN